MNDVFRQAARLGRLSTVFGTDGLVLLRFAGQDAMNALAEHVVDCLCADATLDPDALLGTHATVTLARLGPSGSDQHFDGIVTEVECNGPGENGQRYRLPLRPWFWLAGLRRNQRIFHNRTAPQILTELLGAYADAGDLQMTLTADYPVLEYTVQFRESDLAFATRLMERHGISYHVRHRAGGHTLVLTDAADRHASIGTYPVYPQEEHARAKGPHVWHWRPARRITTGSVRLTDYNFKTPKAQMEVDKVGDAAHAQGWIESFDWPGDYPDAGRGRAVAALRTMRERGQAQRYQAESDIAALTPGARISLTPHGEAGDHMPAAGASFICLTATHTYTAESYGSVAADTDAPAYSGSYTLMPEGAPLTPERKTPLADVRGPQTAVVVGEGEIDCDEYGRVLVRFHWDLAKANSMRCRVSQNWAGNGWGGMVIPRIGMEVLVEFLDGDPDQPLVTGCVYNGRNKVPYALPEHKTRSTFKTDTHQGAGFNELRFEDQRGSEEIFLHAQKDRNEKTLNNHTERIDNNWVQSVGHNKAIEVTNNHDEVIGGNMTLSVGPSSIGQIINSTVAKVTEGIGSIGRAFGLPGLLNPGEGNQTITIEKNKGETVGIASMKAVGISKMTSVGKTYHINVGTKMVITCGKSQISIDKSGYVKITGARFNFSASGPVQINGKDIDLN
jgi:type VI secretion system secreted protein VgrG